MAITPQDIEQQAFSAAKQGYNTEDQLAAAQAQLSERRT